MAFHSSRYFSAHPRSSTHAHARRQPCNFVIAQVLIVGLCTPWLQAGCSTPTAPTIPSPGADSPSSPKTGGAPFARNDYLIQPGDQLEVRFYYHPELDETTLVRPDGKISLQLVDDVQAAGLTLPELRRELTRAYATTLRDPEITLFIRDVAPRRIYVGGEVNQPGLIQTKEAITALKAILQAGGVKETGNLESVVVLRYRGSARPQILILDLAADWEDGQTREDIPLQPFDIVFVPKTAIATANQFVSQYIDQMIPISRHIGVFWSFVF